jgi:hypothetical protein
MSLSNTVKWALNVDFFFKRSGQTHIFCVPMNERALCLIGNESVATLKDYAWH